MTKKNGGGGSPCVPARCIGQPNTRRPAIFSVSNEMGLKGGGGDHAETTWLRPRSVLTADAFRAMILGGGESQDCFSPDANSW